MAGATFYNKKHLCYVDDTDFTDYQGIGSDPLYRRYESVQSVVKKHIDVCYQSFFATPYYEDGQIHWYVDEWNDSPVCFSELVGEDKIKYESIKNETVRHYKEALAHLSTDELLILSGALKYINDDFIYCYDEKVVLICWGMRPDTSKYVINGAWVKDLKRDEKFKIRFDAGQHGRLKYPDRAAINRKKGDKLSNQDIPELIVDTDYELVGWSPCDIQGYVVNDEITFTALYKQDVPIITPGDMCHVTFVSDTNGEIIGEASLTCPKGHVLSPSEIPNVQANRGYRFNGWKPSTNSPINSDTLFSVDIVQDFVKCNFIAGEHGTLQGKSEWLKPMGAAMLSNEVPSVKADKGYKFTGWNESPLNSLTEDKTFIAQYEKDIPWYKKFWLWLTGLFAGKGCLKWLLWLLLALLLLWLLSWLLRGCVGCSGYHHRDVFGNPVLSDDSVAVVDRITGAEGNVRDDNGHVGSIIDDNGNLPENGVVSPIVGDDGAIPPVISNPGTPDVIANRLNIYFEDENADLDKWAHDFKTAYPSESFAIIGYDPNVKMIQIQIPENQRNKVREELNTKIPGQDFFVVDESIMVLHGFDSKQNAIQEKGWHLKATHVQEAWKYTKGKSDIVVAIVDDGIDVGHTMFKGRFYKAYNVFTQNRTLSAGQGHGTHVAALAVGSSEHYNEGAAGVAPNCKIMPIQVFDNGMCTFSSVASGIMYAIHNGAQVINISIGPSFAGLDQLPIAAQKQVVEQFFKNEERVYRHIIKKANEKNAILIFAAGNDNVLTAIAPECRVANKTINVAACNSSYKAAEFTNYSQGTSISAPGVNIYSAFPTNSYKMCDGTSMAAPIVAGAVALLKSINPDLTASQIIGVFQMTGKETDNYIPPMILIDKAIESVKSGNIPDGPVDNANRIDSSNSTAPQPAIGDDDYSSLRDMLNKLKAQRDAINKQIDEIEQKLK